MRFKDSWGWVRWQTIVYREYYALTRRFSRLSIGEFLIFIEALYAAKRVRYGIIRLWTDVDVEATLPPPQAWINFKLSDISWGWNWIVDRNYEAILRAFQNGKKGEWCLWWFQRKPQNPNPTRICGLFIFTALEKQRIVSNNWWDLRIKIQFSLKKDSDEVFLWWNESWRLVYSCESCNQSANVWEEEHLWWVGRSFRIFIE